MTSPERTVTEWKRNKARKKTIICQNGEIRCKKLSAISSAERSYEAHTSCGGTELLYDKMVRLIRSEAIAASADKEDKPQYNKDSNLFVGRSLQKG